MGTINSVIYGFMRNDSVIFEPFVEINKKLQNGLYEVTYRYPDDKINRNLGMKYDEIVKLSEKLNVQIIDKSTNFNI